MVKDTVEMEPLKKLSTGARTQCVSLCREPNRAQVSFARQSMFHGCRPGYSHTLKGHFPIPSHSHKPT